MNTPCQIKSQRDAVVKRNVLHVCCVHLQANTHCRMYKVSRTVTEFALSCSYPSVDIQCTDYTEAKDCTMHCVFTGWPLCISYLNNRNNKNVNLSNTITQS